MEDEKVSVITEQGDLGLGNIVLTEEEQEQLKQNEQ